MDNFNAAEAARRLMALEAAQGAAGVPGMPGTPGGPVQESPTMQAERALQYLTGAGIGVGGGVAQHPRRAAGLVLSGGNPFGMLPGMAAASGVMDNSIWADQLRMKLQGN